MAFRCRDSEETRAFYEDLLGLEFAAAFALEESKTGRPVHALHSFFRMADGAYVAFFEVKDSPFDFSPRQDFDLHMALEVDDAAFDRAFTDAKARGADLRGPVDHGFIRSLYLRDPNGYVVELCVRAPDHVAQAASAKSTARANLDACRAARQ